MNDSTMSGTENAERVAFVGGGMNGQIRLIGDKQLTDISLDVPYPDGSTRRELYARRAERSAFAPDGEAALMSGADPKQEDYLPVFEYVDPS